MPAYEAIVIGASAGGVNAVRAILRALPPGFALPVIIVQHIGNYEDSSLAEYFGGDSAVLVREAGEMEEIKPGTVYIAPAGYHLLIEPDRSFSLSVDPRVNFSCPSIDVLFESAADAFGRGLIGVILTGANADGSAGLKAVKAKGGLTVVQNPDTAEVAYMPRAALKAVQADHIVNLEEMAPLLSRLALSVEGESHGTGTNV